MDWIEEKESEWSGLGSDYSSEARKLAQSWDKTTRLILDEAKSDNPLEIAAWREKEAERIAQEKAKKRASEQQARRTRYAKPKFRRKRRFM